MTTAAETLDRYFPEMRWRALSLAADLDRVARSPGGKQLIGSDPRLTALRHALAVLQGDAPNRAEQVQLIFTDKSPPPSYR